MRYKTSRPPKRRGLKAKRCEKVRLRVLQNFALCQKVQFESGELRECRVHEIIERAQRRALHVRETVRFRELQNANKRTKR